MYFESIGVAGEPKPVQIIFHSLKRENKWIVEEVNTQSSKPVTTWKMDNWGG